eukprot:gene9608-1810_t
MHEIVEEFISLGNEDLEPDENGVICVEGEFEDGKIFVARNWSRKFYNLKFNLTSTMTEHTTKLIRTNIHSDFEEGDIENKEDVILPLFQKFYLNNMGSCDQVNRNIYGGDKSTFKHSRWGLLAGVSNANVVYNQLNPDEKLSYPDYLKKVAKELCPIDVTCDDRELVCLEKQTHCCVCYFVNKNRSLCTKKRNKCNKPMHIYCSTKKKRIRTRKN